MTKNAKMIAPLELGLCVSNLASSRAFYEKTLGFEFVSQIVTPKEQAVDSGFCHSGYVVVRLQLPTGERIKLFAPDQPPDAPARHSDRPLSAVGFAFMTLIVDSLPNCLERLAHDGVTPRGPGIYRLRPGVDVALIEDPDGNIVELVEYLDPLAYRPDLRSLV